MLPLLTAIAGLAMIVTLPYWLPGCILSLRMRIFTRINGDAGITIPGELVDASRFDEVYSHPAANGRSRGASLSDLFWYWLSPGAEIHQEHIEPGELYDQVAGATRRILAVPKKAAETLAAECTARALNVEIQAPRVVRLRDLLMPAWAEFYYQLVFGSRCSPFTRDLIVRNARDVVSALKCCSLRHMKTRNRLTRFLITKLEAGEVKHNLPKDLSLQEAALYLQGVFFNTAVVQMSEAMTHLLLVIAEHQDVQAALNENLNDDVTLDRVIAETLRLYPLFGISHRITSAEIVLDVNTRIPKGSVLCFNSPAYHRTNFEDPERFDPSRWGRLSTPGAHYIPFGVPANRPCPAQGIALITMRASAREVLRRVHLYSSASHTRSIPNRGPCLVVPKTFVLHPRRRDTLLLVIKIRDRWEDVWRSVVQLVLGTYMVLDARRLRLCTRYFEDKGKSA
jgi:Cytochrome P450